MADEIIQRDGRKWSVGSSGVTDLTRTYLVVLDTNNLGANGETAAFTGVPAIGSAHPNLSGLYVDHYDVEEGEGTEKKRLKVTVVYARKTTETSGSGESAAQSLVTEWGWDAGTEDKELVTAANGASVVNSAGDVFESVPTYSTPAPVFTKVIKWKTRQSDAMGFNCKTNQSSVTIGGTTYPAGSLLCVCAEKRIFGEEWKYQYTVQLKYKSNIVKINGAESTTDIGWDVAVTDAGMREIDAETGKLKIIRQIDAETGKRCTVTSPELLDGQGHAVTRSASSTPTPYNFRFAAYATATFPSWFYSEPS